MKKIKVAILDDYQNVTYQFANWKTLNDKIELKIFNQYIGDETKLSEKLYDYEVLCLMRERTPLTACLINKLPNYMYRYQVKPGISGWAQINYPYGASFEDSKNKLSYDFFYILEYSFLLDILIFIKTIRIIFNGSGSKPN